MINKRIFILLLILAVIFPASPVFAQGLGFGLETTSIKEETEKFYNNCLENPLLPSSQETDTAFCACSTSHLQKWFEEPSNETDFLKSPAKELDKNVLMAKIYGPCLFIPVYEMNYYKCLDSSKHNYFMKNNDELEFVCNCIAEGTESYFKNFAQPYLEMRLLQQRDIKDPVYDIMKSTEYYVMSFEREQMCYNNIRQIRQK